METNVLVVDDYPDNRVVAAAVLEKQGHRVRLARDGKEALQQAMAERPDLVLLDLSMPEMDGFAVLDGLRAQFGANTPPILAFTAHAFPHEEARARQAGFDDYLVKPCPPRLLAERVRFWLDRLKEKEGARNLVG